APCSRPAGRRVTRAATPAAASAGAWRAVHATPPLQSAPPPPWRRAKSARPPARDAAATAATATSTGAGSRARRTARSAPEPTPSTMASPCSETATWVPPRTTRSAGCTPPEASRGPGARQRVAESRGRTPQLSISGRIADGAARAASAARRALVPHLVPRREGDDRRPARASQRDIAVDLRAAGARDAPRHERPVEVGPAAEDHLRVGRVHLRVRLASAVDREAPLDAGVARDDLEVRGQRRRVDHPAAAEAAHPVDLDYDGAVRGVRGDQASPADVHRAEAVGPGGEDDVVPAAADELTRLLAGLPVVGPSRHPGPVGIRGAVRRGVGV